MHFVACARQHVTPESLLPLVCLQEFLPLLYAVSVNCMLDVHACYFIVFIIFRLQERALLYGVDVSRSSMFKQPRVRAAVEFAAAAHAGQTRKTGEPYVSHCIETALIVEANLPHAQQIRRIWPRVLEHEPQHALLVGNRWRHVCTLPLQGRDRSNCSTARTVNLHSCYDVYMCTLALQARDRCHRSAAA